MAIHEEQRGGMVHVRVIAETLEQAQRQRDEYLATHPGSDFGTRFYETDTSLADRVVIHGWRWRRSADAECAA